MLRASRRLAQDKALAAKLNLSVDQGRLKDLSKSGRAGLSPDSAAHLRTLWASYQAAAEGSAKVSVESSLVQAVGDAASPLRDPVRQTDLAVVGKFAVILSPGQWKQYEALK